MNQTITIQLEGKTVTMTGASTAPVVAVYPDEALAAEALRVAATRAAQLLTGFVLAGQIEGYELSRD